MVERDEIDITDWVTSLFEAMDSREVERFVAQLAPGAELRVGNAEPLMGRVAIRDALAEFFEHVTDQSHGITNTWRDGDVIVVEAEATYTRADAATVSLPSCTVLEMSEGLVHRMQVYADLSPLFPDGDAPRMVRSSR